MIKPLEEIFKDRNGRKLPCIREVKRVDKVSIVRLQGDIDAETIPVISANIASAGGGYFDRNILLDFKDVTNVDSSTLAYLIVLLDRLQKRHRKLGIVNSSKQLDHYLAIENVDTIIHRYAHEEEALQDLRE